MARCVPQNHLTVFTIGHSTRTLAEFTSLLQSNAVKRVVDVRTIPKSRYNPQFNRETLPAELRKVGIFYTHLPALGGLRHALKDSINKGWRNTSFRGFADYMQTPPFGAGLAKLEELAGQKQVAIMCAEAVPWRCHRSLIADALTIRGIFVEHIISAKSRQPHALTPFAKVSGTKITYPSAAVEEKLLV